MKPVFDENGLATEPGEIRCFYYDAVTFEYTGWSDEYIPSGVSLPGNSTDIDPGNEVAGKVSVFTDEGWEQYEDHRAATVYSISDGTQSIVDYIGPLRIGFTTIEPATQYDKWNGTEWIIDTDKQHAAAVVIAEQQKASLRAQADSEIAWRQDAVDAGIATAEETTALADWKTYRVLLMRVDTAAPVWPTPPGTQVS